MMAFGLLILRVVVGLTVAGHGAQKLFGWWGGASMDGWTQTVRKLRIRPAQPWAWTAALAEFGGGLLVALGLLSPLGSFAIAGSMLVAIVTVHLSRGFWSKDGGYEFPLLVLASVMALALTGPGVYSLDHELRLQLPEPLTVLGGTVGVVAGVVLALATRALAPHAQPKAQTN